MSGRVEPTGSNRPLAVAVGRSSMLDVGGTDANDEAEADEDSALPLLLLPSTGL